MAETDTQQPDVAGDAIRSALGTEMGGPLADIYKKEREASKKVAESQLSQKEDEARGIQRAQESFAGGERQRYEAARPQINAPPPKFNVTQDTQEGLMGLATLLPIAGILIGSKGMMSGTNAMNAMTGVMKGYQEGNKERMAFEKQKYDVAMKEWDTHIKQVKDSLDKYTELAKYDLSSATSKAKADAIAKGHGVIGDLIDQQGLVKAREIVEKMILEKQKAHTSLERSTSRTVSVIGPEGQPILVTQEEAADAARRGTPYAPASRSMQSSELAYRDWIRPGGAGGKNLLAVNTVAQHLNQLEELGKALDNNNYQLINKISNRYSVAVGDDPVTNFNAAKQAVAGEIVRVITQTGGALADRQEAESILDAAKSPGQLAGAIGTIKNLIGGRINSAKYLYEQGTRRKDFTQMLTPDARKAFGKYVEEDASADQSAPNNADPLGLR